MRADITMAFFDQTTPAPHPSPPQFSQQFPQQSIAYVSEFLDLSSRRSDL
jgi:hypothetical protein